MGLDRYKFGQNLSAERKRLNLQVNEVAQACDIKPGTQYLYEQGKRVPNADYLESVFKLGFRPHALLPSATQTSPNVDIQSLRDAFIKTDGECRDSEGRLLDLEYRLARFIDILTLTDAELLQQTSR